MKKLFVLIFVSTLTSCTHQYYVPTYQPTPLSTNQHNLQGSIGMMGADEVNGPVCNFNYSFPKNLTTTMLFTFLSTKKYNDTISCAKANYWEWGFLYNVPLDKKIKLKLGCGYGVSGQTHNYVNHTDLLSNNKIYGHSNILFNKFFLQSALAFEFNIVTCSFSNRISNLHYNRINYQELIKEDLDDIRSLESINNPWFYEPQIEIKAGPKKFKIQQSISFGYFLNNPEFNIEFASAMTSLYFNLNLKRKSAKS